MTVEVSSFADDLVYLLEHALNVQYGVSLFLGTKAVIPNGNGPFVSIIPTAGLGDEGTHNASRDGIAYERPSAQIVFRSESFLVAWNAAQAGYAALNFVDTMVNGTWWRLCKPKQEPFDLGVDDKGKARVVFNLDTVKRLSPASS